MSRTAVAQAPTLAEPSAEPPSEPPAAAFFQQRVTERLASQGVVLSRRKLGLRIEESQDRWSVSLIDLATGQAAASLQIGQLPPDRDAAVQVLVRATADLAQHLANRVAELESRFNPRSLRFAATYHLDAQRGAPSSNRRWVVFRGAVDQELDPKEFYRIVGRDDLAESYVRRRVLMLGSYIVAGLSIGVGLTVQLNTEPDYRPCASLPQDRRAGCARDQVPSSLPVLIGAGLGLGAAYAGTYFYRNPQPIGESEAKVLADTYNQQLLQRLQLPGVARRPVLRDLKLRPYVGQGDIGLVLGARF